MDAKSGPLEAGDFGENGDFGEIGDFGKNRHACNGENFRQNSHFPKGPFAISFEFLFIVWRFWRLIAISAIFANACISGHISIYQESIVYSYF